MDNLNDLKKLWRTANTEGLPDSRTMMSTIKKYRDKKIIKKCLLIIAALILTGIMVMVVFKYKSTLLTTRIGEACILISGIILIATNTNSLRRIYRLKNCTNREFILHLEQASLNRIYYYKRTQIIALVFNSAGLLLYMYEGVCRSVSMLAMAYAAMTIWLLVVWLVIRPRAFKKQSKKFIETVKKMALLSNQF